MKKVTTVLLTLIMVLSLSACGKTIGDMDLEKGQSAIYIQDDGTVSYGVSEIFDKSYYDEDKLKEEIDKEVADYNSSETASVDDAITVESFKTKDKVATLVMKFETDYDFLKYIQEYNNFSEDEFYIGKISDNKECKIKGEFKSSQGKTTVKGKEIKTMDSEILIVKDTYKVQLDGKVKYISSNCSINEDGIVTTGKSTTGLSYIVYDNKDK